MAFAYAVIDEQGLTGAARVAKVNGEMQMQVEVVVRKRAIIETKYRTFRTATPEDFERIRTRHLQTKG